MDDDIGISVPAMATTQPPTQLEDWSLLPDGCRWQLVKQMDSTTRAVWRTVCRWTCQDVHAETATLAWCGNTNEHLSCVSLPTSSQLGPPPSALPTALIASLPKLLHLSCSSMKALSSIQGIPSTLRSLDLSDCLSLCSLAPLQHCTALEQLTLTGSCVAQGRSEGLARTLPPAMSALGPHLRRLKLTVHDLEGYASTRMVQSLAPLTNLQGLRFSIYPLTPNCWQTLTQTVGRMTDLRDLDLSFNHSAVSTLAPAIRQLSQLQSLNLCCNQLDSEAAPALGQALASLPATLTSLRLAGTSAHLANASAMVGALQAQAATLRRFDLASTFLNQGAMQGLAPGLQCCTALTDLDFGDCDISAPGSAALAVALTGSAPSLTSLEISGNYLEDQGAAALAPVLITMTALTKLGYQGNELSPAGAVSLLPALTAVAPNLTYLDLSDNRLGDEGATTLAPALHLMTALKHLRCSGSRLGPAGAAALAPALSSIAPSLTSLSIANNPLGDDGAAVLVSALRGMTALEQLQCRGARVGAMGAGALASALPAMTRLKHLNLEANCLHLEVIRALARALQALPGQQRWKIQFNHNHLKDGVPCDPEDALAISSMCDSLACPWSFELQAVRTALCDLQEDTDVKVFGMSVTL